MKRGNATGRFLCMGLIAALVLGSRAAEEQAAEKKEEWQTMSRETFRKVIKGRCPIIWKINPNDPGYEALVREKAASGVLVVIAPAYLKNPLQIDLEAGVMKHWRRKYKGSMHESLGWGPVAKPPVDIPQTNFPVRYEYVFTDKHLEQIKKDGLLLYSYGSGIEGEEALAVARKCRAVLGDRFIVMRRLEATNRLFEQIYSQIIKADLDPRKVSREKCFEIAKDYAVGRAAGTPEGFGFGASNLRFVQAVGLANMERWDTEYAHGPCQIHMAASRGVKQQYDVPFAVYVACMHTSQEGLWGRYLPKDTPYDRWFRFGYASGGKPPHLLNRIHWVVWFSDADSIVGESAEYWNFVKGKDAQHFELSGLGKKLKKLHKFADTDFFDRGEPYIPACVLLDYQSGWTPGGTNPDAHSWDPPGFFRRKIWGTIDFKKRDYMIDNFMGAVFPGFERAGSWGTTLGGELCPAPYGDSFDILMTNAEADTLKKYPVLIPLGLQEMPDGLQEKLAKYVQDGGTLVLDSLLMNEQWKQLTGIKMTEWNWPGYYTGAPGYLLVSDHSQWKDGTRQKEHRYFYYMIDGVPDKAEVLAMNPERNHPLIVKCPVGKGTVYYTAIQHMQESSGVYRPYGLTKVCKRLIEETLKPHQKVFVEGDPIQYIVRTSGDTLLVMAVNNQPEDWTGKLHLVPLKAAGSYTLQEWYVNGEPVDMEHKTGEGRVTFSDTIPAHSLKLYTLK